MIRPTVLALIALVAVTTPGALAGEAEVNSAKEAISSQIEAFKAGENDKAFSYAAPSTAMMFPNVEAFMAMVEHGYKPVQRPQQYSFGRSRELGTRQIMQEVLVTGPDGKDYLAIYQMILQQDGTWKISGVSLAPAPTSTI